MALWLVRCAAGCGTVIKRDKIRPEAPICRECRRKRALLLCEWCDRPFRTKNRNIQGLYCCAQHAVLGMWRNRRIEKQQGL